jgi:hypothetical protein
VDEAFEQFGLVLPAGDQSTPVLQPAEVPLDSITERGPMNGERESSGERRGQARGSRRSLGAGSELSRWSELSQVVAQMTERNKRREANLSASCDNQMGSGNSANRKSSL